MNRSLSCLVPTLVLAGLAAACGGEAPPPAAPTSAATVAAGASIDAELQASVAGGQRTDKEKARDSHRHPRETLAFFGLKDDMTVVELSPGGGWFTAILAPVLRDHGKLVVVGGDPNGDPKSEGTQNAQALQARFQKAPSAFDKVQSLVWKRDGEPVFGPPESADMVLTFRNLHNWVEGKNADQALAAAFKVLKHGGVLGVTDHRANKGASSDPKVIGDTGYIPEEQAIKIVEAAGFKLAAKSEINANPKDTKDYAEGVWTLPPTFTLKDKDHDKYAAIGESDRMTLKFVKVAPKVAAKAAPVAATK